MHTRKKNFTFKKHERLCSRKTLESVFVTGKSINEKPLRFLWIESPKQGTGILKIAISVPKKKFKRAVDRNKIKRQIREAYRLNKYNILSILENSGKQYSAIIIFTGKQVQPFKEMQGKIILTLQRFAKEACQN